MCSYTPSRIDGSLTSIIEWGVDLLWYMHIYASVLIILKGHEPFPGMVYGVYTEWDTLLSLLLSTLAYTDMKELRNWDIYILRFHYLV